MAKEPAPSPVAAPPPADRQLWQLPTFLLGLAALLAVAFGRGLWRPEPGALFRRDLDALAQALDRIPPDLARAAELRQRVEAARDRYPELAGQVEFLLGSADLAVAESRPPGEATEEWESARARLEKAEQLGVADRDRGRLAYRLAKAWEEGDAADPQKVIDYLTRALPAGGDPSEGYRRLAEAYLRLPTPDLPRARDALQQQLGRALPHTQPQVLTEARLRLGDVLAALNQHEEARKVLERVGPEVPEVYARARLRLGRSHMAEANWPEAVRALEQARDVRGAAAVRGEVLYHLGLAYQKAGRRPDALAAWEEARRGGGPEAQAAGMRLGELMLREPNPAAAAAALADAAAQVPGPGAYANPLLPLNEARAIYEQAVQVFRLAGDFDSAQKVTAAYAKFAEPGHAAELTAENAEMWAQALAKQAAADPVNRDDLLARAREQFAAAAEGYKALAGQQTDPGRRAALERHATDLLAKAGQRDGAPAAVAPGTRPEDLPEEKRGEALYQAGEAHLARDDKAAAREAFEKAAALPGPAQARARLALARLKIDGRQPEEVDSAIADLEKNLAPELRADRQTHEPSLFTLATVLFQVKRDYARAEQVLREGLSLYPDSPYTVQAQFQLGRCYWYQAAQASQEVQKLADKLRKLVKDPQGGPPSDAERSLLKDKEALQKQYLELLRKSAGPFRAVEAALLPAYSEGKFDKDSLEWKLLRQALFALAEHHYYLGEYPEAVRRYRELADRYKGHVEELAALSQVWNISTYFLHQPEEARAAVARMRESFAAMKPEAFDGSAREFKREFWEDWFRRYEATVGSAAAGGPVP